MRRTANHSLGFTRYLMRQARKVMIMGYYINPQTETKEQFLAREGILTTDAFLPKDQEWALVCLVDNRIFTAAGIAFSPSELECFTDPGDRRPKLFFLVLKEKLYPVSDILPENFKY